MPTLPLTPPLRSYRGATPAEARRTAERIVDHVNRLIADDPAEIQMYTFGEIAAAAGATVQEVRDALPDFMSNGITIRVTDADRARLAPYRSTAP